MKRRNVVRWLLAIPLSYLLGRWGVRFVSRRAAADWRHDLRVLATTYADDVAALARTLLPSSLGHDGANAVARDFIRWLDRQNPDAELNHLGYMLRREDIARLRPGTRRALVGTTTYIRQLESFKRHAPNRRLGQLSREQLGALVTLSLQVARVPEIPPAPTGENLALDILSFFYTRPSATDVFHGRRIAALECRGLDGVERPPAPLLTRSTA